MTDDDPEEPAPAPAPNTKLMKAAVAAEKKFRQARELMLVAKDVEGALGYCHAKAALKGARAALPPLRLVSSR